MSEFASYTQIGHELRAWGRAGMNAEQAIRVMTPEEKTMAAMLACLDQLIGANNELAMLRRQQGSTPKKPEREPDHPTSIGMFSALTGVPSNLPANHECLSFRACRVLRMLGAETLLDATRFTEDDFRAIRNCGDITVEEIKTTLAHYNLSMKK